MTPNKPRILLAEDHEDTRELLVLILTHEHYEIASTPSVGKALELSQRQEFDIMLIDSRLSDGTGLELCRAIRQYDGRTPIMFYSALGYEKDKREAIDAGAQDYLVKPVNISTLIERLRKLLTDSKSTAAHMSRRTTAREDSGDLQPSVSH